MDYWCEFCDQMLQVPIQEDRIGSRPDGSPGAALDKLISHYPIGEAVNPPEE